MFGCCDKTWKNGYVRDFWKTVLDRFYARKNSSRGFLGRWNRFSAPENHISIPWKSVKLKFRFSPVSFTAPSVTWGNHFRVDHIRASLWANKHIRGLLGALKRNFASKKSYLYHFWPKFGTLSFFDISAQSPCWAIWISVTEMSQEWSNYTKTTTNKHIFRKHSQHVHTCTQFDDHTQSK